MPTNSAIYLSAEKLNIKKIMPDADSDGSLFHRSTFFEFKVTKRKVRLNVMPAKEVAEHLKGMAAYVRRLKGPPHKERDALRMIQAAKHVLGIEADLPLEKGSDLMTALANIATEDDDFFFAADNILTREGDLVVGPRKADAPPSSGSPGNSGTPSNPGGAKPRH